ncbi:MAG: ABC transporter ATP-binding protein [Myxococcota bacterium]|jgi:fluoroquinolone transport system ATP-binding protein
MIDVRDLEFCYPGSPAPTVRGLNFEVTRGEIFGFLGPSGAGKSTTQKVLIGLLRDYSGRVVVFDRELSDWNSDFYENVGVSFEYPNLYQKLSAVENLRYFAGLFAEPNEEPEALLERVGLAKEGSIRVSQLSKGMKVRLGFVRALLNRPKLLFLDEPTAGLDPVNAQNIKEIIRSVRDEGATVFLTTHDMTVADQLCDRVAFIVDGELRCVGSPRALKLEHGRRELRVEFRTGDGLESTDFPLAGIGDNADFTELLRTVDIETIHTQETTLEQVFIDVTGRRLT